MLPNWPVSSAKLPSAEAVLCGKWDFRNLQGDTLCCFKPPFDIKTKVPFKYEAHVVQNATLVLVSTGGLKQRDVSPCKSRSLTTKITSKWANGSVHCTADLLQSAGLFRAVRYNSRSALAPRTRTRRLSPRTRYATLPRQQHYTTLARSRSRTFASCYSASRLKGQQSSGCCTADLQAIIDGPKSATRQLDIYQTCLIC